MEKLENELAQFRKVFNERVLYFRQLQEVSDSVAEIAFDGTIHEALEACKTDVENASQDATSKRTHLKYLESLATADDDEDSDQCIICTDTYTSGWIFDCAHRCCESCLKLYVKKHKNCPVCRKPINFDLAQRILNSKPESQPESRPMEKRAPRTHRVQEFNRMPYDDLAEIQQVETIGSFGSKIQSLVRHLVWLQEKEPGAKSIVFSAWADSLSIVELALQMNGIPCLQINYVKGARNAVTKFRSDPSILVFLLHGERENAGLNLIEATRVFCVEPVVNHAFETQAIARIDRMGQKRDTEVFCYYSEDTVERNILDLAVKQGVSLYTQDNAIGTLLNVVQNDNKASNKAIDSLKRGVKAKGDFVHSADDMLAILFPHLSDETLYDAGDVIDSVIDEDVDMDDTDGQVFARQVRVNAAEARRFASQSGGESSQAGGIAGPSGSSSRLS